MHYIVLDDEQARIIAQTAGHVELRDRSGKHLGYVAHGFDEQDLEIAKQRRDSTEPGYSTVQVLEHLRSLATE